GTRRRPAVQRRAQFVGRVRYSVRELPPGQDLLGQVGVETDEGCPVRRGTGDVGDPPAHGEDHRYRRISASRRTLAALMNSYTSSDRPNSVSMAAMMPRADSESPPSSRKSSFTPTDRTFICADQIAATRRSTSSRGYSNRTQRPCATADTRR